ncbi:hypothetical protein B4147_2302 [Bacillus wiedmannii]|uniref:Uncharacterized protein n=2 Tax=Bacillus cereus group TaxID=86661 RepID=A0A0G8F611_BACCE|nr:hypothetical protein B4147_2302 [Bacillus wiedmannii]KLA31870.1 hypothetical protein B4077_2630 [Bacillus cereus]
MVISHFVCIKNTISQLLYLSNNVMYSTYEKYVIRIVLKVFQLYT